MPVVTRARRTQIQREAAVIRIRGQREGLPIRQVATAIRSAVLEVSALEAWRLALGWSRAQAIEQIAKLYIADGLRPPGLSAEQLCRFEHGPDRPGPEYAAMLARAYGARLDQLGLATHCRCCCPEIPNGQDGLRYGRAQPAHTQWAPIHRAEVEPMTTAAGLPAVRESLHLAILDSPGGSPVVVDLAEAAVEHYALNYSKHPPVVLFDEVHTARGLLAGALTAPAGEDTGAGLRRAAGWLSGLLGNVAFHLGDHTGARAHLTVATALGHRTRDARLIAWSCGVSSMLARTRGDHATALDHAAQGLAHAAGHLQRAQLLAWARLPSLAALGRAADADQAMDDTARELEADQMGWSPGRFGFDSAEYRLHAAEAQLVLGRHDQAAAYATTSIDACILETPGWAAATAVLAQAEAPASPADAAQRALDLLDRIPAARLRSTTRGRLSALGHTLYDIDAAHVGDLRERLRTLPPSVDIHGRGATS